MAASTDAGLGNEMPTPRVDPPEPPRPDELDTWSPGLTDESGDLPISDALEGDASADVATGEPTG
jgi:hypothetical protein